MATARFDDAAPTTTVLEGAIHGHDNDGPEPVLASMATRRPGRIAAADAGRDVAGTGSQEGDAADRECCGRSAGGKLPGQAVQRSAPARRVAGNASGRCSLGKIVERPGAGQGPDRRYEHGRRAHLVARRRPRTWRLGLLQLRVGTCPVGDVAGQCTERADRAKRRAGDRAEPRDTAPGKPDADGQRRGRCLAWRGHVFRPRWPRRWHCRARLGHRLSPPQPARARWQVARAHLGGFRIDGPDDVPRWRLDSRPRLQPDDQVAHRCVFHLDRWCDVAAVCEGSGRLRPWHGCCRGRCRCRRLSDARFERHRPRCRSVRRARAQRAGRRQPRRRAGRHRLGDPALEAGQHPRDESEPGRGVHRFVPRRSAGTGRAQCRGRRHRRRGLCRQRRQGRKRP